VVVVQPWGETEDVGLVWGVTEKMLGAKVTKESQCRTVLIFQIP
jgi:hypothetical protein